MKIDHVVNKLINLYAVRSYDIVKQPFLIGPPGIGKSFTIKQAAKKIAEKEKKVYIDYNDDLAEEILKDPKKYFVYVDLRLTEVEPSDLSGIPRDDDKVDAVHFKPLLWARCLSKCSGILLLDELTNVNRPDITSAAYKLIYDHRAGFTQFSDDVMIVVAGNPPETSSVANSLPAPLISRMVIFDVSPPSIKEWGVWMHDTYDDKWEPTVLAFLMRFQTENIFLRVPKETETLKAYPTPRTWSSVAVLAKLGYADDETIEGLLGGEVGAKYAAFKKNNVNLDELLAEPLKFSKLSVDAKYMASTMLSSWFSDNIPERVTEKNKPQFTKKIEPALKLIDAMSNDSREFVLLSFISMPQSKGLSLVMALAEYDKKFYKMLQDITMNLMKNVKVDP